MKMEKEKLIQMIQLIEGTFSISEKRIFIELIKLSINDEAVATVQFLKNKTSVSNTTIYITLKTLQLKGYILKTKKDTFNIVLKGVEYITELFEIQNKHNINKI